MIESLLLFSGLAVAGELPAAAPAAAPPAIAPAAGVLPVDALPPATVALDSQGFPHLAYYGEITLRGETAAIEVRYARLSESGWNTERVATVRLTCTMTGAACPLCPPCPPLPAAPALALDGADRPQLAFIGGGKATDGGYAYEVLWAPEEGGRFTPEAVGDVVGICMGDDECQNPPCCPPRARSPVLKVATGGEPILSWQGDAALGESGLTYAQIIARRAGDRWVLARDRAGAGPGR